MTSHNSLRVVFAPLVRCAHCAAVDKMASRVEQDGDSEAVRQCEEYVESHNIQPMLKECIFQLCLSKPSNPLKFLREYFEKLEKVRLFILRAVRLLCTFQGFLCASAFNYQLALVCHEFLGRRKTFWR